MRDRVDAQPDSAAGAVRRRTDLSAAAARRRYTQRYGQWDVGRPFPVPWPVLRARGASGVDVSVIDSRDVHVRAAATRRPTHGFYA
jgi:hypothetical protein